MVGAPRVAAPIGVTGAGAEVGTIARMPTRHLVLLEVYPHAPGGAQVTTGMLAERLTTRGWTTEIVAPMDGPVLDDYRVRGIDVTVLPVGRGLLRYGGRFGPIDLVAAAASLVPWWLSFARHLRARGAALLDVIDQRGVVLGGPAAVLAKVPWVWHIHTPGRSRTINAFGHRSARTAIVASRGVAAELGGVRHVRIPVTPRELPRLVARRTPADPPRVVAAARLHPVKGYDVFLEAIAQVVGDVPELVVEIYGAPQRGHEEHASALGGMVEDLGLARVVRFCGHQPRPWEHWDGAALYVLPSINEPFGIALVEAMAAGLPVIATRTAGPTDILDDGRTGLLVDVGDATGLAAAIRRVLGDDELALNLARAGREHALATYRPEDLVERTAAVFDALI